MTPRSFAASFLLSLWRMSLRGARDGRDSVLLLEFALAPRARLLATKDLWVDAVFPLAVGLGLSKYYQLVDFGDSTATNHVLGYASGGLLFDIMPRFVPARLGNYNRLAVLTALLQRPPRTGTARMRALEVVAGRSTAWSRFHGRLENSEVLKP